MCEDKEEKSERKRIEEKIVFRKGRLEHTSVLKRWLRGRGGVREENQGLFMKQEPSEGGRKWALALEWKSYHLLWNMMKERKWKQRLASL